jgi:hypothetical protein
VRRVTIYASEVDAQKAVGWLEDQGFDFMSEDYADPSLQRRPQPIRRTAPERHEPSGGFLPPTMKPSLATKKVSLASRLLAEFDMAGILDRETVLLVMEQRGLNRKAVRDGLNRLLREGKLVQEGEKIWRI